VTRSVPPAAVEIPEALAGERVDRVVALLTGRARSEVTRLIASRGVRIGGAVVDSSSRRVRVGEVLDYDLESLPGEAAGPGPAMAGEVAFGVVYEDPDLLVVDKPAGIVVHPDAAHRSGTLVNGLLERYPEIAGLPDQGCGEPDRPGIVHRLDKDTSGLLVVARTPLAFRSLSEQLAGHLVERVYHCMATGRVESDSGTVDAPVGRSARDPTRMAVAKTGRAARTHYEVTDRFTVPLPATELVLRLETGRTHQIRVHLAAIGHPVLGDVRYKGDRRRSGCPRPFLHATRLSFAHPSTGEVVVAESALPAELVEVRARFSRG